MIYTQQTNNDEAKKTLPNMIDILKSGFENKVEDNTPKNITLVLGLTGSYKRDLIQLIAGNEQFNSSWDRPNISTIKFPDLIVDTKTNTAFYDYPEFERIKTVEEETSAKYLLNKIINYADSIKLIFTIFESQVESDLYKHINSLLDNSLKIIKNFSKLKGSIALIVTKVDNFIDDKKKDNIPDNNVIQKVVNILNILKKSEGLFNKEKQTLINTLLRNENEIFSYIGVFKKPQKFRGQISENEELLDNKKSLEMVINTNTMFTINDKNNFCYDISLNPMECATCLDEMENAIKSNISMTIRVIGQNIIKYYENQEKQLKDFKEVHDIIGLGIKSLESLNNKNFSSTKDFLRELMNLQDVDIIIPQKIILSANNYAEYLSFIQLSTFIDSHSFREHFISIINEIIEDLKNSQSWYTFLIDFYSALSRYNAQESRALIKHNIKKLIQEKVTWNDKEIDQMEEFDDEDDESDVIIPNEYENRKQNIRTNVEQIITTANLNNGNQICSSLEHATISNTKLVFLSKMLTSLFYSSDKMDATCSERKLRIQGQFVKLSDIPVQENLKCNKLEPAVKTIELFASNTIFIDGIINKTGEEVHLSLIAPTLEIVGEPKIILNGKPGEGHEEKRASSTFLAGPGSNGNDGIPGKPGGPAGSLLLIGLDFINAQNLTIYAVGGKGGPGQNGSDGVAGKNGEAEPTINFYDTDYVPKYKKVCNKIGKDSKTLKHIYKCIDNRYKCTDGGKGGNGGVGGKGGKKGDIDIIKLEGYSEIRGLIKDGEIGSNGTNGKAKEGGRSAMLSFELQLYKLLSDYEQGERIYEFTNYDVRRTDVYCKDGKNDEGVFNSDSIKEPESPYTRESSDIIVDYKSYVRSICTSEENIREQYLRKFLTKLENNSFWKYRADPKHFINELQSLEMQFYELHRKLSFLPFYESLLNRIRENAKWFYENKERNIKRFSEGKENWFDDRQMVLKYLYAATMSKILSIRDNKSSNLVLDIDKYLNVAIENIKKLNDYKKITLMNEVQENYYHSMNKKISEALNFFPEIKKKMKTYFYNVDKKIKSLIDEIKSLEGKVKKRKEDLQEMEDKLKNAIEIRSLLAIPKMAGQIISLAGPVGHAAGTAISVSSTLIEALNISEVDEKDIRVEHLPIVFNKLMPNITELTNKQEIFLEQLGVIEKEFKNTERTQSAPPSIVELEKAISTIKNDVEKEKQNGASIENINKKITEVTTLLESEAVTLADKKYENNTTIQSWSKGINRAKNLLSLVNMPIKIYTEISKDQKKIELVTRVMKESNDQLKKLDMHKQKIYETIVPRCRSLQSQLLQLYDNNSTREQSHAALDISKWKMQGILREVKYEMYKATEGLQVQEDIARLMEQLDHALATMIDVYDRIEDYRDRKELADYIKNINTNGDTDSEGIKDEVLKKAINDLKVTIQSNIVLEEYERAIHAVKQIAYPMADQFLATYELPISVSGKPKIDTLTKEAAEKLINIKQKFELSKATIQTYDTYSNPSGTFNVTDDRRNAYYIWKYAENKEAVSKLLKGEEVMLKSDIRNSSPEFSAIKFNEIGMDFIFTNKTIEEEFKKELSHYNVQMTHLGNSQYRCHDKFHIITNDELTLKIEYSAAKGNTVFAKLRKSEPFLSPYTLWKISLKRPHDLGFESLKKYENMTIDLALEGVGFYIENSDVVIKELCNNSLSKYYKKDETISGITTTKLYNKVLDEIPGLGFEVKKPKKPKRARRSLDNYDFKRDLKDDSFATSGACSGVKSSFINNIFNLAGTAGLLAYEYLDPVNKIRQWFMKHDANNDQENIIDNNNVPSSTKMLNIHSLATELPKVSKMFIDEELPTTDNLLNDSSFCNHGNLLLLDLLIRSKNGVKYSHESIANFNINNDPEYAQHLAYREHIK